MKKVIILLILGIFSCSKSNEYRNTVSSFEDEQELLIIQFDYNGGFVGNNVLTGGGGTTYFVKPGEFLTELPENPWKTGYIFSGWYRDENFINNFLPDTQIYNDISIYAKWVPEIKKIKYVSLKGGINIYSKPSLDGTIVDTLLFGTRIIITENISVEDTVDGNVDFWYNLFSDKWVFGGFLSNSLPLEAPFILDRWEIKENPNIIWHFLPNFTFVTGPANSGFVDGGNWELSHDILILHYLFSFETDIDKIEEIKIEFIDSDNIFFVFPNGDIIHLVKCLAIY